VILSIESNPLLITYKSINDSYSSICLPSSSALSDPSKWQTQIALDLIRLHCINNFDYPINTKYIWMYLYNPETSQYETWHKFDTGIIGSASEDTAQEFHNPDTNRDASLSSFLKYVFTRENYAINFQCGTYYERYNVHETIYLLARSKNITIIKCKLFFKFIFKILCLILI
jgi:hypothetical protein